MKNQTKIIIHVSGGIIQSVHSNQRIHYVVVDEDLMWDDRISDVYQEDGIFDNAFDVVDIKEGQRSEGLSDLNNIAEDVDEKQTPLNTSEDAIDLLLKNGYIRHLWHIDDIKHQAEVMGIDLSDDQLNDVIIQLEDTDANIGINWDTISIVIGNVIEDIE